MKTPHVHAALIKQWADGATIQYKWPKDNEWTTFDQDAVVGWHSACEYRVKPEPKPDVILYAMIAIEPAFTHAAIQSVNADMHKIKSDTCMFVFDGETGELKDAQVLASSGE